MVPRAFAGGLSRYTAAGAVATTFHYLSMAALIELARWPAGFAAMAAAPLGALVSYVLNRSWTFAGHAVPHRHALPRFLAVAGAGVVLNVVLVWTGTAMLGWHWLAAQAVATLAVLLMGYAANHCWTFRQAG